jgi:hypothetical protein
MTVKISSIAIYSFFTNSCAPIASFKLSLQSTVTHIHHNLEEIRLTLDHMRAHEARNRHVAEQNNDGVQWWSAAQCLILLLSASLQVKCLSIHRHTLVHTLIIYMTIYKLYIYIARI